MFPRYIVLSALSAWSQHGMVHAVLDVWQVAVIGAQFLTSPAACCSLFQVWRGCADVCRGGHAAGGERR